MIDLSFIFASLKAAAAEKEAALAEREAAARKRAHQAMVDYATRVNFAGLRFHGVYRTASRIPLDRSFAAALELSLRFKSDLVVEYICRALDDDNGMPIEVDHCSDQTKYDIVGAEAIRLAFDTGTWVCEWEGSVRGDVLQLSYRIEEYCGLSPGPKCVLEGEASLGFEPSPGGE